MKPDPTYISACFLTSFALGDARRAFPNFPMLSCCYPAEEPEQLAPEPPVELSAKQKGASVTLNGRMISGSGSIFADSALLQDKCYFEATVVSCGTFAIGVATRDTDFEGVLTDKVASAWTANNSTPSLASLQPGDVVGCAIDQADYPVQVYYYKGGARIHQVSGIRGEVLPVFSVSNGASLEVNFGSVDYAQGIPAGFQGMIKSKSIL